jgi:fumarate reductase flavoprotein subunit
MHAIMEASAGIFRTEVSLRQGAERIAALREELGSLAVEDRSLTFNTERIAALELAYMLDVAEAIVASALARKESRGSHQRSDFPARDDERYLAHTLAYLAERGPVRIEYLPVTITRWTPGQRVYGR